MKLLGEEVDLRANGRLLFHAWRSMFYLLILSAFLDAVSTMSFMILLGSEYESNRLVRLFTWGLGIFAGPLIAKIVQVAAVWGLTTLAPRLGRIILLVAIGLNFLAFGFNMLVALGALMRLDV